MNFKKFTLFVLLIPIVHGCGQGTDSKLKKYDNLFIHKYDSLITHKIEYRDSLFVLYTIRKWSEKNWYEYGNYVMYKIKDYQIQYYIAGVFYSPDLKKIIVWIGEKMPNAESIEIYNKEKPNLNRICPTGGDTIYNLSAVIGFRDSLNQIWKLYPLINEQATCFGSKEEAANILGQYYFDKMKSHSEAVNKTFLDSSYGGRVLYDLEKKEIELGYDDTDGPFIGKEYGYNLQDKDFWTKSLLWQKGARIPGLYNFQTKGNVTPDKTNVELMPPEIQYPDSILEMYTGRLVLHK